MGRYGKRWLEARNKGCSAASLPLGVAEESSFLGHLSSFKYVATCPQQCHLGFISEVSFWGRGCGRVLKWVLHDNRA